MTTQTSCWYCKKPLSGDFLVISGMSYHLGCFKCCKCGVGLAEKQFVADGEPKSSSWVLKCTECDPSRAALCKVNYIDKRDNSVQKSQAEVKHNVDQHKHAHTQVLPPRIQQQLKQSPQQHQNQPLQTSGKGVPLPGAIKSSMTYNRVSHSEPSEKDFGPPLGMPPQYVPGGPPPLSDFGPPHYIPDGPPLSSGPLPNGQGGPPPPGPSPCGRGGPPLCGLGSLPPLGPPPGPPPGTPNGPRWSSTTPWWPRRSFSTRTLR
eukprot:TRINITY_DN14563_c0_g1_i1.p1 TRINITY_DN14563_c0_g1~~TRINITY_DN14563_c0_g1_i1.p1  ORF type:complete len:274 (-),score=51.11 TRINITY_DN14563_c0_g1_i1:547-1329(-)